MNTHVWTQYFLANRDRFTEPPLPPGESAGIRLHGIADRRPFSPQVGKSTNALARRAAREGGSGAEKRLMRAHLRRK